MPVLTRLPVAGPVNAASAETMKCTEPNWFTATIHQPRERESQQRRNRWQISANASCPETRNSDVRGVVFADSTFLNILLRLRHTRPLALQGPLPSQLARLLELTGALALFEVRDAAA